MKTCSNCKLTKYESEFHKKRADNDGLQSTCVSCGRARSLEWSQRPENAARRYQSHLKHRFKLTPAIYDQMLASQNGVCAICSKTPEENGKKLAVDHDHSCCSGRSTCGKCVRGLLCDKCNIGMGAFNDSAERLGDAQTYLLEWSHEVVRAL